MGVKSPNLVTLNRTVVGRFFSHRLTNGTPESSNAGPFLVTKHLFV
jgi:hypothetical protein